MLTADERFVIFVSYSWIIFANEKVAHRRHSNRTPPLHSSGTCSLASSVCLSSHQVLRRCAWYILHLPSVPLCLSPSFQSTTSPLSYTKTSVKIPATETGAFNVKLYSSVEKGEMSFRELLFWTIFCHFHRRVNVGIEWFYYRNLEKSMQEYFFTQTE